MMRMAFLLDGPHVGIATLQAWCPAVSRRMIAEWRRRERQRQRRRLHVLHWTRPRRVWAMDFSEAPQLIEGEYRFVLHVRDLASHYHLAALPVTRPTALAVCDLLRALCAIADPPLVLKVDNGAAFISHAVRAWAAGTGTQLLYSPCRWPRYNGGIEASIGALTARTHHGAAAAGHPEYWRCENLEAARVTANTIARRPTGRSAWQCWCAAPPITARERRRFQACCTDAVSQADSRTVTPAQRRNAIVATLQALAYVSIKRRADLVH